MSLLCINHFVKIIPYLQETSINNIICSIHVIISLTNYKRGEHYAEIYPVCQAVKKIAAGDQQKQAQKLGQH